MIRKELLVFYQRQLATAMINIKQYNRWYFYGGRLYNTWRVRLLIAIIAQGIEDLKSKDEVLQQDALDFFEGEDFKRYCLILEALYE